MAEKPILEMRGITKYIFDSYGVAIRNSTVRILDKVDFDLNRGEVHILVGENGAGKSTLMKVLGGLIPPDEGEVLLDGKVIRPKNAKEALEAGIGFIHQELNLCGNLSVSDNIFMGREIVRRGVKDKSAMQAKSAQLLDEMGVTNIPPETLVKDLSTAQQQIVEIAKVLSYDCRIIIMDEPTSSLTQREIDILFALIDKLRAQGVSIIYISHRLEEFERVGDRLSVLRDGQSIGTLERRDFDVDTIVAMMVGRTLGAMYENRHVPGHEPVLEVRNLRLEEKTAPISMHINAGEIVGMGGLVGAGRTELAKSVFGYRKCFGGEVFYQGRQLKTLNPADLIRHGIVYLTEDRKSEGLVLDMDVAQNISLASLFRMFPRFFMFGGKERELAEKTVSQLNVVCNSLSQLVRTLSGGNQQKIILGKCLATNPRLLILDEPTRGIDVGAKAEIYRMIDQIAESGVAVMMISSDMPELIGMSDRIYVMRGGAIVAEIQDKADMTQENILAYTIGKNA